MRPRKSRWILLVLAGTLVLWMLDEGLSTPDPKRDLRDFNQEARDCLDPLPDADPRATHYSCEAASLVYENLKYDETHQNCRMLVVIFRREILGDRQYKCARTRDWADPSDIAPLLKQIEVRSSG
jgi:hypothetical protein